MSLYSGLGPDRGPCGTPSQTCRSDMSGCCMAPAGPSMPHLTYGRPRPAFVMGKVPVQATRTGQLTKLPTGFHPPRSRYPGVL